LAKGTVTFVGVIALSVMFLSVIVIALVIKRERDQLRTTRTVLTIDSLLVGAGGLIAWSYRIVTAGGVGANIGVGLVVFFGAPLLLAILVTATVIAIRTRKRTDL
jgi:hypothetical protein